MRPVTLLDNEQPIWTPSFMVRALIGGVDVGGKRVPFRRVVKVLARLTRVWWCWQTALPGDRFYSFVRDTVIELHEVKPGRRTARLAWGSHSAIDAILSADTPSPIIYEWWELEPCR